MVDGEGGSSERCLKWGGGGWGVIKGSFQKHLKTEYTKLQSLFCAFLKAQMPNHHLLNGLFSHGGREKYPAHCP